jgi:hypothetical protein
VKYAQELQLAEFKPGDAKGDQLVVVTGPSSRIFASAEDLNELEFATLLCNGGQESADVQPTDGYSGEDVIAYRSTKVCWWDCWGHAWSILNLLLKASK